MVISSKAPTTSPNHLFLFHKWLIIASLVCLQETPCCDTIPNNKLEYRIITGPCIFRKAFWFLQAKVKWKGPVAEDWSKYLDINCSMK